MSQTDLRERNYLNPAVKRNHGKCAVSTLIKWQTHKSPPAFIRNCSASISCSITRLPNAPEVLYLHQGSGGQITGKDLWKRADDRLSGWIRAESETRWRSAKEASFWTSTGCCCVINAPPRTITGAHPLKGLPKPTGCYCGDNLERQSLD